MSNNTIFINTLMYMKWLDEGVKQEDLIHKIAEQGIHHMEVRREYLTDFEQELKNIRNESEKYQMHLYYSVPDEIFVNGQINPKLTDYMSEAKQMDVESIKWNIGDFANYKGDLSAELMPLLDQQIEINIENNQTEISGTIQPILTFLKTIKAKNLDIGYVYDLGNWRFVNEDEFEAAEKLKTYTRFIHIKDINYNENNQPVVQPLDEGVLDWRKILTILPNDVPVALEYPVDDEQLITVGIHKLSAK